MKKKILILAVVLLAGCTETVKTPPDIKPLNQHLMPAPQNWKDAYGDTLQTQLVYNASTGIRDDQTLQRAILATARTMQNVHDDDPNEVIWRAGVDNRVKELESKIVDVESECQLTLPKCPDCKHEESIAISLQFDGDCPYGVDVIYEDVYCDKHNDIGETFNIDSGVEYNEN